MEQPRKHHYLPQFYLRGFSSNQRSVYQIEKKSDGRSYLTSIGDAGAIRDYHRLDYHEAPDPNAIEKKLATIESEQATAIKALLKNGLKDKSIRPLLIQFVSMIRLRVPPFRAHIEKSLQETVRSGMLIMERRGALSPPPEKFKDLLKADNLEIKISNWKIMEHIFNTAFDPKILTILDEMNLVLFRTTGRGELLTCDQPVTVYHPTAKSNDPYGIGIVDPLVEISIPISKDALLLLSWDKKKSFEENLTEEQINEFNRRTVVMAHSYIFAPKKSKKSNELVNLNVNNFAGFEMESIRTDDFSSQSHFLRPVMRASQYK